MSKKNLDDTNAYRRYLQTAEERDSYREAQGDYVLIPNGYRVTDFRSIQAGDSFVQGYSGRSWEADSSLGFNAKRFIIEKINWRRWIPCFSKSK